jgi:GTP cyclohydrolase I
MATRKVSLSWNDVLCLLKPIDKPHLRVFGIPKGGMCASTALQLAKIVYNVDDANIILDDIVDSGATRDKYKKLYPDKQFYSLVDKTTKSKDSDAWIIFPWENQEVEDDIITRLLQYIGEDPKRGGLRETPKRVMKAWDEWTSGYNKKPSDILKTFEDGAEQSDQMVTVNNIPIWSHCEHHMAPFFGSAKISYIPDGKIVGLSKLARLADMFARRLQVQERLTNQIADALQDNLNPIGIGVEIKCRHLCMESRGIKTHSSFTKTIALRGAIKECEKARYEFLSN